MYDAYTIDFKKAQGFRAEARFQKLLNYNKSKHRDFNKQTARCGGAPAMISKLTFDPLNAEA